MNTYRDTGGTEVNHSIVYKDVSMTFGQGKTAVQALEKTNFGIGDQEFLMIVGPSGCGKSTLLHITAGLLGPTTGEVLLDGKRITGPGPDKALVFQNFSLFPWKTIWENIDFGLRINGVARSEREERVTKYIRLTGLAGFEQHYPRQLSGGMQQRVALARSFVMRPRVLLMDEPFAALDAQNRTLMQEELVRIWSEQRTAVLFITHAVEEAVYLADRIIVMSRRPGRIKEVIDINAVTGPQHWRDRPLNDVSSEPKFQEMRHRVWDSVREEISSYEDA